MHWWAARIITATPSGARLCWIVSPICAVSDSCTCSRRAKMSTTRASFDSPTTRLFGQIGHVGDAGERRDVVLAMAFEAHVAQQDHVAIAGDVLEGAGKFGGGILAVAAEPLLVGFDDALGRIGEPRARRIVAGPGEQRAHGVLGLLAGWLGRRRRSSV